MNTSVACDENMCSVKWTLHEVHEHYPVPVWSVYWNVAEGETVQTMFTACRRQCLSAKMNWFSDVRFLNIRSVQSSAVKVKAMPDASSSVISEAYMVPRITGTGRSWTFLAIRPSPYHTWATFARLGQCYWEFPYFNTLRIRIACNPGQL